MSKHKCNMCHSPMVLKETKNIAGSVYQMWFCEKCKRSVAKSS